jgi:hypothetical protein
MDLMSLAPPALFPLKFPQNGAMLVPFILRPEISLLLGLLGRHKLSQNFVLAHPHSKMLRTHSGWPLSQITICDAPNSAT